MKIGIDIDEIVAEYLLGYIEFYNQLKKTSYKYEDFYSYNFWEPLEISKEEAMDISKKYAKTDAFRNIALVKGAKKGVNFLSQKNEIIFITSRPISIKEETESFFDKHFPLLKFKLYFSGDFWKGNKTKAEICLEERVDIMVEDNLHYALDIAQKGIKVFMIDCPWNQKKDLPKNLLRVKNWNELLERMK